MAEGSSDSLNSTIFALTGVQVTRSSVRTYRPVYYSGLAPIYEDGPPEGDPGVHNPAFRYDNGNTGEGISKTQRGSHRINQLNDSVKQMNNTPNNVNKLGRRHRRRSASLPSRRGKNMLNDIMNKRFMKHRNSEPANFWSGSRNDPVQAQDMTCIDIIEDRFERGGDTVLSLRDITGTIGNDSGSTKGNSGSKKSSRRKYYLQNDTRSSIYQGHLVPGAPRGSEFRLAPVVLGDEDIHRNASHDIRRLTSETELMESDDILCCPAERKLKNRGFILCFALFVVVVIIIGAIMVDRWMKLSKLHERPPPPGVRAISNNSVLSSKDAGSA